MSRAKGRCCDTCHQPVSPGEGVLVIDEHEALMVAHKIKQYPCQRIPRACWRWGHDRCIQGGNFIIPDDCIDTPRKALGWTLELVRYEWFAGTDWDVMMDRLGYVEG